MADSGWRVPDVRVGQEVAVKAEEELNRPGFQIADQYCPNVGFENSCNCK